MVKPYYNETMINQLTMEDSFGGGACRTREFFLPTAASNTQHSLKFGNGLWGTTVGSKKTITSKGFAST